MTNEEQVLAHLELMARAIYRIGKEDGPAVAKAQISGVMAALEMMDQTLEATLNGPGVQ